MTAKDPLGALRVWDRLEVGPVQVEQRRLTMPYRVTRGGKADSTELVYKYGEDVFDPAAPDSANLASMVGAQLALNYSLFCREMVLHGDFDDHDRRFLQRYARHTAREIYVIKFLYPNPFLLDVVSDLPLVKREDYGASPLVFSSDPTARAAAGPAGRGGHAVLSSGGKDSLLSYGLLNELELAPHSIFINESGRHWFTALNAYRYLMEHDPATARVWTNCDRVYAWMLRRVPFVRQDFGDVRSDDYPIRLWTVAVFLFGALPLLRKRGIDRLVIGDEFDTTARMSFNGVTHYNGLFDQSRYFDNAVTRYFAAKSWGLCQFSLLRPLSELLIEKTLAERYPHLQEHQLSCHAAHEREGRIKPCGRCEKCRRIVGMLKAFGADPRNCGYTDQQIETCLRQVATKGVHQERVAARHLTWLLAQKGLIPAQGTVHAARRDDTVMSLRFDAERSPFDTIPNDLREPLYRIFMEHAEAALRRVGRQWIPADPFSDESLATPYRFASKRTAAGTEAVEGRPPARPRPAAPSRPEPTAASAPGRAAAAAKPAADQRSRRPPADHGARPIHAEILLGELTWPEAEERLEAIDIALLPVGAIEQHGAHLPLDTDAFDADRLAREVADACSDPKPLVLPLVPYGVSYHHEEFKGTISIGPGTLARLVHDIGMSAAGNGITKLVIINGHGGNIPALHYAAQTVNRDAHIFTCVDTGETSDADILAIAETPNDVHAGEIETSTSLWLRPDKVQMDKAKRAVPRFSTPYLDFTSKRSIGWYGRTKKISRSGVLGDATRATREKGEQMWGIMVRNLVELVEDLKRMTLEEIHQTKY